MRQGWCIGLRLPVQLRANNHFAKRVLFIRDGQVYHQIYKGDKTNEEMYQAISDTLTLLQTGGK